MSELTRCSVCGSIFKSDLPVSVAVCQNCRAIDPYKVEVAESFRNLTHKVSVLESKMREVLPEYSPAPPQPAPVPKLVEAVEKYLFLVDKGRATGQLVEVTNVQNEMRLALSAEKRRQELVAKCLDDYEIMLKMANHSNVCDCTYCTRLRALDAFDKERGA